MKRNLNFFAILLILLSGPWVCFSAQKKVFLGLDVLEKENFKTLKGTRVALITNHTGLNRNLKSTVGLFHKNKNFILVCVMTPEHGFRGTAQHGQQVADSLDEKTGVPVYSLYGATTRPTAEMLKGVNTVVFDIQDIGTRFYTYITTLGQAMEEAAKRHLMFVVLDRPNPIQGDIIEGDILDADIKRMTGYFPLPVRHGLTVGELALWFNEHNSLKGRVSVVKMKNWTRDTSFKQTDLVWTPPSPNIRSLTGALLYPGIGCFEATNVSVGRGTSTPFQLSGAPWISSRALCAYLRSQNFPGVLFEEVTFTPNDDIYKGEVCYGVNVLITHSQQIRPYDIFVHAFHFLYQTYPTSFKPEWEEIRVMTGSSLLKEAAENKIGLTEYFEQIHLKIDNFRQEISAFYLY